nr:ATP cone domain-containing protein [Hyphomonas sp. 34-62-18]
MKDSRSAEDDTAVRRRRVCESCGARFTTFERVQLREIMVVKRDGKRVPFDRERLARSITIALRKRPVDREQIDQMVSGILRKLESTGEQEVTSNDVGAQFIDKAALEDEDEDGPAGK